MTVFLASASHRATVFSEDFMQCARRQVERLELSAVVRSLYDYHRDCWLTKHKPRHPSCCSAARPAAAETLESRPVLSP